MAQVSPSTSLTLVVRYPSRSGMLAHITAALAEVDALIRGVLITDSSGGRTTRSIDVEATDEAHQQRIVAALGHLSEVDLLSATDRTFALHVGGKIRVESNHPLRDRDVLSRAYTPGVARVCKRLEADPSAAYRLSIKGNAVAIVTDGSAVLGLGNIGPYGALPVMEGKAMLFKEFANVDAFPLCLDTQDPDAIIETVQRIAPVFGGINLEDITAPKCFYVEEQLKQSLDMPVFHDDQHGTAVVVTAGLKNALTVTGRTAAEVRVVISGAGAAGLATAKLLLAFGVGDIILCDSRGAIWAGRGEGMNEYKEQLATVTNRDKVTGDLAQAVRGADVFIGVSKPDVLAIEALRTMAPEPIVFALANPIPEVDPEAAIGFAGVLATGRSDYPNQINNAIAFPGIFRGLLDIRATDVNQTMMLAAAEALAATIPEDSLSDEQIIPSVFQPDLANQVAAAVATAARGTGAARSLAPASVELGW